MQHIKRRFFLLKFFLSWAILFPGLLFAQAGQVHEYMLDNGLKLIVKEDHRAPVAVSQIWYKIGSSYEQSGKTGLSHLLEHMMFKGTNRYAAGEFSRIMAANGARENAFTSADYTAYFQRLEKSRLRVSFEMEADRMRNLVLEETEFAKEKKVVIEERRLRTDDKPTSLAYEVFKATAYQTSPYQNPTIGWLSDIQNLSLADLQAWYTQWYSPNNATLTVVGDVVPREVLALAKKYFGPLKSAPAIKPLSRPEVKQLGIKRVVIKRPAKLPYLIMGYKAPVLKTATNEWEPYALEVLAEVLDGDDSARLTKHLVRGQEIAASVGAGYDLYSRLTDLFVFSGVPAGDHSVSDLETALREQIKQAQETLVTKSELDRIKIRLQTSKIYELDSVFYQAMQIGMLETVGLNYKLLDEYVDKVTAVTPEQVQAAARKYLLDEGLTVAVLEPLPLKKGMH
ncbi:MAG: insulinase family protein [Gammaproteobacteria bacterium]|nr:insulinase family protein [Gammaproteobacteria bacterium]